MKYFFAAFLCVLPLFGSDSFYAFPPMEVLYHPVSTSNPEAQKAFNRGLLAIYGFNYDEAYRSFEKASQLDSQLAMAYWGMALSLDQALATFIDESLATKTFALVQKALALAKDATENERAYIYALENRFSKDPTSNKIVLRIAYEAAMEKVIARFPDDLDAVTLAAESRMDAMGWSFWTEEGKAREGTLEIMELLESVLKRDPLHVGANHYYIHAVEDSKDPERGLMAAYQLDHLPLSEWGHLLHTSSHIYMRVGSYEKAVEANKKAIAADRKYIAKHGINENYAVHSLTHNLSFLNRAYLWQERYAEALSSARELEEFVEPLLSEFPGFESMLILSLEAKLYFHQWDDILNIPQSSNTYPFVETFLHFARAMAYASLGNLPEAKKEQADFLSRKVTDAPMLSIAEDLLSAILAKAEGDFFKAIIHLKAAIEKQVPSDYFSWYYPIHQTLGALLIEMKKPEEAEVVFRETLESLPRNGRSLFGLSQALKAQNKFDYWIEREMKQALKYSGRSLTLKDL